MQLQFLAADSGSVDPYATFAQYGVLGVIAFLLFMFARGAVTREREKSDQAEAQVQELNNFIRNELLPKQVEATLVYKQVAEVLEEAIQLITEVKIRDSIRRQDPGDPPPLDGRRG